MAQLYFSRDVKVYVQIGAQLWDIPVLEGFSFSQTTNAVEITINEMGSTNSTRGRKMFNDSLAPAEWSFSTYARPFISAGTATSNSFSADNAARHHAIEESLWALLSGPATYASYAFTNQITPALTDTTIDFSESNRSTLGTATIWFHFPDATTPTVYKLTEACVNEATLNFDIDGIATIDWSGMAQKIVDAPYADLEAALGLQSGAPLTTATKLINEGATCDDTGNFIRNRLSTVTIQAADIVTFPGKFTTVNTGEYSLVLTGGSITINNNLSFLTPSSLACVNVPLGHVTGARTVSGSLDCYLNGEGADGSGQLFEDLIDATSLTTNSFNVVVSVGGTAANNMTFNFPTAHFEIPSHDLADVVSLTTNFHALPSSIDATDEVTVVYKGLAL